MAGCFSTGASAASALSTYSCVSYCLRHSLFLVIQINHGLQYCFSCPYMSRDQGWGQIRFIKYKYKNLAFSNTNTNTSILLKFDSNTNTNTNTSIQIQIQIQICSTKYICQKIFGSKIGQFYKSPRYMLMVCVSS